jgi:hypothetical protein
MPQFALGGVQLGLEIGDRTRLDRRRSTPVSAATSFLQAYKKIGRKAQLLGNHPADLPLFSQFCTASRLKVSSNLRRFLTDVVLMDLSIHDLAAFSVRHFEATPQDTNRVIILQRRIQRFAHA